MSGVYDNLDIGHDYDKLANENRILTEHIKSLGKDVEKLCAEMRLMKARQDTLTRNISELFNTAKVELARKDKTIADLRRQLDDLLFRRGERKPLNSIPEQPPFETQISERKMPVFHPGLDMRRTSRSPQRERMFHNMTRSRSPQGFIPKSRHFKNIRSKSQHIKHSILKSPYGKRYRSRSPFGTRIRSKSPFDKRTRSKSPHTKTRSRSKERHRKSPKHHMFHEMHSKIPNRNACSPSRKRSRSPKIDFGTFSKKRSRSPIIRSDNAAKIEELFYSPHKKEIETKNFVKTESETAANERDINTVQAKEITIKSEKMEIESLNSETNEIKLELKNEILDENEFKSVDVNISINSRLNSTEINSDDSILNKSDPSQSGVLRNRRRRCKVVMVQ